MAIGWFVIYTVAADSLLRDNETKIAKAVKDLAQAISIQMKAFGLLASLDVNNEIHISSHYPSVPR